MAAKRHKKRKKNEALKEGAEPTKILARTVRPVNERLLFGSVYFCAFCAFLRPFRFLFPLRLCVEFYSFCFESIQIVTGPSFTSWTDICAPNTPRCTGFPSNPSSSWQKSVYRRSANSGGAARTNEGRLPFLVLA